MSHYLTVFDKKNKLEIGQLFVRGHWYYHCTTKTMTKPISNMKQPLHQNMITQQVYISSSTDQLERSHCLSYSNPSVTWQNILGTCAGKEGEEYREWEMDSWI